MFVLIKVKDTENVIGLKEDIAMRLEGVADIERIEIIKNGGSYHVKDDTITADIVVHERLWQHNTNRSTV